jgi:hypothetical protein
VQVTSIILSSFAVPAGIIVGIIVTVVSEDPSLAQVLPTVPPPVLRALSPSATLCGSQWTNELTADILAAKTIDFRGIRVLGFLGSRRSPAACYLTCSAAAHAGQRILRPFS